MAGVRLLIVLAFVICTHASSVRSQNYDLNGSAAGQAHDLHLEVFINNESTRLIAAFRKREDGSFAITQDELGEIGLLVPPNASEPDGLVSLDRLSGVQYVYDELSQTIQFTADDSARAPHVIQASSMPKAPVVAESDIGAVLNYTIFGSTGGTLLNDLATFEGFSGAFDARLFSPLGIFHNSAIVSSRRDERFGTVRLDTNWSYSDPSQMLTYTAGDLISGGLSWTRPVRLAGLQVRSNFRLRPDLVTLPLPSFEGSAAVPSTIEIYSNNSLLYAGNLPAGPFVARDLPVVAGSGEARVVLTDALGRETVTDVPFYAGADLLRGGIFELSMEAGFPRRSYGTESFDYHEDLYASASLRSGLYDWLTLEGHTEVGERLVNAGAGLSFPLGQFGAGSIAVAGSATDRSEKGIQFNASVELELGSVTLFGRTQRSFGDYRDIAAVSSAGADFDALPARALEQLAISFPLTFDDGSLSFTGTHIERWKREPSLVAALSYSRPMPWHGSLFISTFLDVWGNNDFGASVGFSLPLGVSTSVTTGAEFGKNGVTAYTQASRSADLEAGSLGWRVRASADERQDLTAGVTYRAGFAQFDGGIARSVAGYRATAQIEGAVVAAGGGVFATDRIDDAFAVVDVGEPSVDVYYENRPIGTTNRQGRLLVPGLRSYERNKISIDPRSLPVTGIVPQTEKTVVPADRSGITVEFGVSTDVGSAVVEFHSSDGKPIEVGSTGKLQDGDEFIVGYDGQAYIVGLAEHNMVTITQPNGAICNANFTFTRETGVQTHIEGVACLDGDQQPRGT